MNDPAPALRELVRDGDAYRFLFSEEELAVFLLGDTVEDCNGAAARLLGVPREAIVGRPMLDFCAPVQPDGDAAPEAAARRIDSALAGLPQWCQWRFLRPDGAPVETLAYVEAVRVGDARRILVRARDYSRLERAEESLRARELQLRQILDNTTAAIVFAKDLDGRYLFVNRAFERLAGRPQREIVGRLTEDIFPAPVAAVLRANDRHVLDAGRAVEFEEEVSVAGETLTMLASKFPLLDAAGRPYAVCGFAADITGRKRTERALERAALAVSRAGGAGVFETLVRELADILGVGAAMISVFFDAQRTHMRSLATCVDGRILKPFDYELAMSPCAGVVGREFRFVSAGVRPEFKPGTMFAELGFDSYAAYSLVDARGEQVGLMVVMDRRPLADRALTESMLKIFAVRAAAEIERGRAEEALRASEASYRSIFEASEDAIFIHDWDTGAILDVSPKAAELYGYSREELRTVRVGKVSSGRPPYTEEEAARRIQHAKVRSSPVRFEWHARHRDGHLMWHEVTLKRATIAGEPRVLAFVRDVTQRKLAGEALRASEEQYRAIFDASADALALRDARFRVVDVNPAMLALTGFARDEVVGSTRFLFTPPEDHASARELFARELAGEGTQYETEGVRRDGTRIAVEVRGVPVRYRGQPHVLVIARDITERKRAEEAVRASEEQYRAIFNASADALVLWNSELKRVDVNPAYERLYGFTREEVLGTTYPNHLPAEYVERRRELVRRTLAGEPCQVELDALRKTGEPIHVEVRTIPVRHRGEPHVLAIVRDVTQRKLAEQALRASEEQYRAIFDASVDGLLLWGADHRIVDANRAFLAMHGYAREELVGQDRPVFIPDELQARCATLLPEILGGKPCHLEARTRRKDGSEFDVEIHGVPMTYQGRPHVLIVLRDITARKEADEALRASEERYRMLFDVELDAIVLVDAETLALLDANPAALALYGYSREELLALRATDLSTESEDTRTSISDPSGPVRIPVRWHRKKDGAVFPVEITANRFLLNGRRTVLAAIRDITERKRAEQALRTSEEQYRAIFNASADALVLRDARFRIVDVNATWEAWSGFSREEGIGVDRVLANPPEVNETIKALHRRALAGEPIVFETQLNRRDGGHYEVELRGVPILHQGEPHVLYLGRDITARKRAETQRRELEAQLRQAQKMEAIGHLTGGIAHDFNNILTSVMGYLALAEERSESGGDAKLAGYLEHALGSCRRARDLIRQMLTFSRGGRGEPHPLRLDAVVQESATLLRSPLPSTVELVIAPERDVPAVLADRVQIEQILLNLAINARDAMAGEGRLEVGVHRVTVRDAFCESCRTRVGGDFVEIAVSDTGAGIPAVVMDRMFEPFFSTKETGKGSGMGLAMVHGIVHEHGGHILVDSRLGQGSTFRVLLPVMDDVDVVPGRDYGESDRPAAVRGLRGRVLVVDDEPEIAGFLRELLGGWGLEVEAAADGEAARQAFERAADRFDLVITDQTMPRMTGTALARELKGLRPDLPIVLFTGYVEGLGEADAHAAGVSSILRKPIEPGELRDVVRLLLSQASAGRA